VTDLLDLMVPPMPPTWRDGVHRQSGLTALPRRAILMDGATTTATTEKEAAGCDTTRASPSRFALIDLTDQRSTGSKHRRLMDDCYAPNARGQ